MASTLSTNLNDILTIKNALKTALSEKGYSMNNYRFEQYAALVTALTQTNAICDSTGVVYDFMFDSNVTDISNFKGWEELAIIRFPQNVIKITDEGFGNRIVQLTEIYIYNDKRIVSFPSSSFESCDLSSVKLFVPPDFVEAYQIEEIGQRVSEVLPIE